MSPTALDTPAVLSAPQTNRAPLTPTTGRARLQTIFDLSRPQGPMMLRPGGASRMPGEPALYVGSFDFASNLDELRRLGIGAVLNCAPSACTPPVAKYAAQNIEYFSVDARDDQYFNILERCLAPASAFISSMHADGRSVLVHCMAGVNRSATLAVAHLLLRDRRCFFELARECIAARPCILQNPSFQLQLCTLASRHGLLYEPPAQAASAEPLASR